MNYISVKLSYKASGLGGINNKDLKQLERELKENYITHIRPNPGPQAGGLVDVFVEVMLDTSFKDFFRVMKEGLMLDVVMRGKKSLLLKPLFDAFKSIEATNKYWDYGYVSFLFNSTEIIVHGMDNMFTSRLGMVFNTLSKHYKNLGEPYQIIVPIAKEKNNLGDIVYSNYEGEDCKLEDYEGYWGVSYNAGFETMIYNVKEARLFEGSWIY